MMKYNSEKIMSATNNDVVMTIKEFNKSKVELFQEPRLKKIGNIYGVYQEYKITHNKKNNIEESEFFDILIKEVKIE